MGFGLAGLAAVALTLWIAFDELMGSEGEVWFGLTLVATIPVLVGMAYLAPKLIFARDSKERTLVIVSPVWSICQAIFLWLFVIAVGAAIAGWWGALTGTVAGGVVAVLGVDSMRRLREAVDRPPDYRPRTDSSPTRRQIAGAVVKAVLFWTALLVLYAGAGYAIFGRTAAIVTSCLIAALIGATYVWTFRRLKRRSQVE